MRHQCCTLQLNELTLSLVKKTEIHINYCVTSLHENSLISKIWMNRLSDVLGIFLGALGLYHIFMVITLLHEGNYQ